MAGILFIHGGESFAKRVYRDEGRAYWSAGFPLVLEKFGLSAAIAGDASVLSDSSIWDRYDAVLISRLPEEAWTEETVEVATRGRAGVLVEGPLPAPVASRLGVKVTVPLCEDGILTTVNAELHRRATGYGYSPSARIQGGTSQPVPRVKDMDWTAIPAVPLSTDQAAAWRVRGWDTEGWKIVDQDTEVLADWVCEGTDERSPAVVRNGGFVAACFSMFAFMVQRHTSEPYEGPEHRTNSRVAGLETLTLALIDWLHSYAGAPRARVLNWPAGIRWVRNVRHDFDRSLPAERVAATLALHRDEGSRGTWYWRARHAPSDALSLVADDDTQEVALHTEQLWVAADEERDVVEGAIGRPISGTSAHGDPNCFRYQGAPNVLWAEEQCVLYTELVQQAHYLPHRFPALQPDGEVRLLNVICVPHHESLDRSTTPGDTHIDNLKRVVPSWVQAGGFLQILNHPDINHDELFSFLAAMPDESRVDWTAAEVADWWRRTHVSNNMSILAGDGGSLKVRAAEAVENVVIEVREPDGSTLCYAHSLAAGEEIDVRSGRQEAEAAAEVLAAVRAERAAARAGAGQYRAEGGALASRLAALRAPRKFCGEFTWAHVMPYFGEAVKAYLFAQGRDDDDPAVQSTVDTNSSLVPKRGDDLVRLTVALTDLEKLAGLRILEAGSGWGALASYIALTYGPAQVTGVDVRPDFIEAARHALEGFDLPNIRFMESDMTLLEGVSDSSVDLLVANNAFIYLTSRRDQLSALRTFHRVLAPGGHVLMFHANRWTWNEPFTQSPLVHLLNPRVGILAARAFGWRHNIGRVRYPSPREMRRLLRRAGFRNIQFGVPRGNQIDQGFRARFERFYGIGGRKPLEQ